MTFNDLQSFPIAISQADWPAAIATAKQFFTQQVGIDCWLNSEDYVVANTLANGPIPSLPVDSARLYQPWAMRPGVAAGLPALVFALDASGNPIAENFTAATTGGNVGGNPPETFVQPGAGTPTLTMQVLGGGSFANFYAEYGGHFKNGIPRMVWADVMQYNGPSVHTPNFSVVQPGFAQLPVGWFFNDPGGPSTWDKRYVPYITDARKVRFVRMQDVVGLGKFGAPAANTATAPAYRNSGAQTAAVIAALQAAGFSGADLGDAVNKSARMVV
jgi:hypothetical protein